MIKKNRQYTMTNLTQKTCVACEGGAEPLQGEKLRRYLKEIEDWQLEEGQKIQKKFEFKNFNECSLFLGTSIFSGAMAIKSFFIAHFRNDLSTIT